MSHKLCLDFKRDFVSSIKFFIKYSNYYFFRVFLTF